MSGSPLQTDVCIYGAGLGGIAAALVLLEQGRSVVLVEPTAWIGGQMTSQGVSALDEHLYIEHHPGTAKYGELRRLIRQTSARLHGITGVDRGTWNPGNGWVSRLCFEPRHALSVLEDWFAPWINAGTCTIYRSTHLITAQRNQSVLHSLTFVHADGTQFCCSAAYFIDASELGDVLASAGLTTVVGAEAHADTQEALAPMQACPAEVQGFTFSFAVSYEPGSHNIIAKPEGYNQLRDDQPFTLVLHDSNGQPQPFRVFAHGKTGLPPFWTYRRIWDGSNAVPPDADIALINWNSNDYHRQSLIGATLQERATIIDEAKRLSLAFLYFLQTEVPRDDGCGFGYPELRLLPELMGTYDGLSMAPYVRESRRTPGIVRITADDILVSANPAARARAWPDSIGIGWYPMDLHPAVGNAMSLYEPTRPFQIPLGALIPPDCANLICANKNIATTHLSNGAYRLHPVEWSIGTGAGMAIAVTLTRAMTLHALWSTPSTLAEVQLRLIQNGVALCWAIDVLPTDDIFAATQWMLLHGVIAPDKHRSQSLMVFPDQTLTSTEYNRLCHALAVIPCPAGAHISYPLTWKEACVALAATGILTC